MRNRYRWPRKAVEPTFCGDCRTPTTNRPDGILLCGPCEDRRRYGDATGPHCHVCCRRHEADAVCAFYGRPRPVR